MFNSGNKESFTMKGEHLSDFLSHKYSGKVRLVYEKLQMCMDGMCKVHAFLNMVKIFALFLFHS